MVLNSKPSAELGGSTREKPQHSLQGALSLKATKGELATRRGTQPLPEYEIPGAELCHAPTEGVGCTLPHQPRTQEGL